jgi:threonine dehydrogenase-like Zn-dependent dehydrogenase
MRSVVFFGKENVRLIDLPVPQPGKGEVLLRVCLAGLCATDRHIVAGHFAVRPPRVLGHELVGVVEAVGLEVNPGWVGKLCGVRPARFCGECVQCRDGKPQLCQKFECLGNTQDGAYAEYALVPADQLVNLNGLPPEAGVWLEPLACVLQALTQLGQENLTGPILIVGAGVLGKLMLKVLLASGSPGVAVIDPNPSKVAAALEIGAQAGWIVPRQGPVGQAQAEINSWAPAGIPVIVDTTGSPVAIQRALEWARPGGKVLLFGVFDPTSTLSISPHQIFSKELTILASSGMSPDSFELSVEMLQSGRIDPQPLIATTIDLGQLPPYLLGQVSNSNGKVVVCPVYGENGSK